MTQDATTVTARRRRTQERLLDAALEVLAREGLDGASVEAVCEAAGFTRGAFYSNFESKTDLFLAVIERERRERLAHVRTAVRDLDVPGERGGLGAEEVTRLVELVLAPEHSERDWYVASIEMQFELLALRQPEIAPRFLELQDQLMDELTAVLEDVVEAFGQRFVINAHDATALIMAGYERSAKLAFLRGVRDHATEVRRLLAGWLPAVVARLTEPVGD